MSETKTEVALVSLPVAKVELEKAFLDADFRSSLIAEIKQKASSVVGDVNTKKGRDVFIGMASKVRSTKTMIDNAGKELVAELKAKPALIDSGRRQYRDELDALAVLIRKPATDKEEEITQAAADKAAEEERKWQEAEAKREAELAAQKKESDHEMALLLNEKFDRDLSDRLAEQERLRIENEERIRKEAAEQAVKDEQARHQAELVASAQREAAATAEKERIEREAKELAERAEREKGEALAKAEREKQEAIDKTKCEQEAAIQLERQNAKVKEDARIYAEQCRANEAAARAANIEHKRKINRAATAALVKAGIPEEYAQKCIIEIASLRVPQTTINY